MSQMGGYGAGGNNPGIQSWHVIVAPTVNVNMITNNGYIADAGGRVTFALPTVSSFGDEIQVINYINGWTISQAVGQQIQLITNSTTLGAGGSLSSTALGDSITLVCIVANTLWQALSSEGNITVV